MPIVFEFDPLFLIRVAAVVIVFHLISVIFGIRFE